MPVENTTLAFTYFHQTYSLLLHLASVQEIGMDAEWNVPYQKVQEPIIRSFVELILPKRMANCTASDKNLKLLEVEGFILLPLHQEMRKLDIQVSLDSRLHIASWYEVYIFQITPVQEGFDHTHDFLTLHDLTLSFTCAGDR